jgi:hypothetical protein
MSDQANHEQPANQAGGKDGFAQMAHWGPSMSFGLNLAQSTIIASVNSSSFQVRLQRRHSQPILVEFQ